MKRSLDDCTRYRESISLLASGVLPESGRAVIESHLITCGHCQKSFDELRTLVQPLTNWEQNVGHVEPDKAFQARWEKAIQSASSESRGDHNAPVNILCRCWQELIWPCRRTWAAFAAVWLLMLVVNVSLRDPGQLTLAKSSPSRGMMMALQQQEQLLVELSEPHKSRAVTSPPKPATPHPRSDRRDASQRPIYA